MTDLPHSMRKLPTNDVGLVVPWFVATVDGAPDFRVMDGEHLTRAVRERLCWVCGRPLMIGAATFVIGPMCAVNHVSAEPPSHPGCARYSATTCPFLTNPKKRRREAGLPEGGEVAGVMIARNPGVTLLWASSTWRPFKVEARPGMGAGVLFDIGEPVNVAWYAHGRQATRDEVLESFATGCPALREIAEREGAEALAQYERQLEVAMRLVPS